jgi:hypothetical protein
MQSTLTVHETDPHDIFVIEPDVVLAARPDAARPDAPRPDTPRVDAVRADAPRTDNVSVDPVHEALSRLAHQRADIQPKFSVAPSPTLNTVAPSPTVDTTFRAAAVAGNKPKGERSAFGRRLRNTFVGFLFALVSAMGAALWTHHGNAAKQILADYWLPAKQTIAGWLPAKQTITGWLPPFILAASSPTEPPPVAEQPSASPTQTATADQASAPPVQPSDSAAPAQASAVADASPSPLVQSMARDIATMGQQIEQLKASIEQLKASQAQMARDVVKSSELNQRPRVATLPPRPVVAPAPVRKPKPVYQTYQPASAAVASTLPPPLPAAPAPLPQPALSQPSPPPQAAAEDGGPVMRPPLPLR